MTSKVLVLNSGSSSLKFKLFENTRETLRAIVSGVVERIGDPESTTSAKILDQGPNGKTSMQEPVQDHTAALDVVLKFLRSSYSSALQKEVSAVGHRVVHGGFHSEPQVVTDKLRREIQEAAALAPLHNPANLQGITAATKLFPECPQVAVFDTAFHQTMLAQAYMYALPWELWEKDKIRRYGFHGTSYRYLRDQAAQMLHKPVDKLNMIAFHIGAGASVCAIKEGVCIDTSMGLTPLEGLVMGVRCGDIDPAVVTHLQSTHGWSTQELDKVLNKKSGLMGLCGQSDVRNVLENVKKGDERAVIALDVYVHRIRKYLGSYLIQFGGNLDALVFSAGVGENSARVRQLVCEGLEAFGIQADDSLNAKLVGKAGEFQASGSAMKLLVIPTDEELSIAQQTLELVASQQ